MDSSPSKRMKYENQNGHQPNENEIFHRLASVIAAPKNKAAALAAARKLIEALEMEKQQALEEENNQLSGSSTSSSSASSSDENSSKPLPDEEFVDAEHPEWYTTSIEDDDVVVKVIKAINNTQKLRERICFDLGRFVRNLVARCKGKADFNGDDIPFLFVGGRTQVGKTVIKVITLMVGYLLGFSTVIVTTLNSNRADLAGKCIEYSEELDNIPDFKELSTLIASGSPQANKSKLKSNGGLIIALTTAQCENAASVLMDLVQEDNNFRYAMVLDECDALWRTTNRELKLEQGLEKLVFGQDKQINSSSLPASAASSTTYSGSGMVKPAVVVNISATIMPTLFLTDEHFEGVAYDTIEDVHELIGTKDYVGLDMQVPFKIDGNDQFLQPKELTKSNQYWSSLAQAFYADALKPGSEMVLILDICNSRVTAEVNIYDRAEMIQRIFPDIRLIIFCVSGSAIDKYDGGIKCLLKDHRDKSKLSDYIKAHDKNPNIPIIVIGYSQMIRGISYRSGERVPTHILNFMGASKSSEDLIQSRGRATGNFKGKLTKWNHLQITLLATEEDYNLPDEYSEALDKIRANGNGNGSRFADIEENGAMIRIVRGKRGIGPKKLGIDDTLSTRIPEDVEENEDEENDESEDANQYAIDFLKAILKRNLEGYTKKKLKDEFEVYDPTSGYKQEDANLRDQDFGKALSKLKKDNDVKMENKKYKWVGSRV